MITEAESLRSILSLEVICDHHSYEAVLIKRNFETQIDSKVKRRSANAAADSFVNTTLLAIKMQGGGQLIRVLY